MDCPKCSQASLSTEEADGLQVDVCSGCGGIWFDRGELHKALQMDGCAIAAFCDEVVDPDVNFEPGDCPSCGAGTTLLRVQSARNRDVTVDYCGRCRGLWLDGGEFVQIKDGRGLGERMAGAARDLLNRLAREAAGLEAAVEVDTRDGSAGGRSSS